MLDTKTLLQHSNQEETLYLIDGSGFIFRAFHALPMMTRSDGTPINAVLGFTNMLLNILFELKAKHIAVIFDAARRNYRNEIYPDYKANRGETPPELIPQFPLIKEVTKVFNIPSLEMEGFEADDLIATYAFQAKQQGVKTIIVSSDKDLMQLVCDQVLMFDAMKNKLIGIAEVIEKFGVPPEKVIDVQSLSGDSIDNIPGVPGIGPKTASDLINEYHSLEGIYEQIDLMKPSKKKENLIAHKEDAFVSKKLVRLHQEVPVPYAIDELRIGEFDSTKIYEFLKAQQFRTLQARLEKLGVLDTSKATQDQITPSSLLVQKISTSYKTIFTIKQLEEILSQAHAHHILAIDTETDNLTPSKANLVGISLCVIPGESYYIPLRHQLSLDLTSQSETQQVQLDLNLVIDRLKPILENPAILKIGHNIKYDMHIFAKHGVKLNSIDDTLVISYLLEGGLHGHSLDELGHLFCGVETIKYKDVTTIGKKQLTFDYVPIDKATQYAAEDADLTHQLHHILKPRLREEEILSLYETIERPLIPVVFEMEHNGIKVDAGKLRSLSCDFSKQIQDLSQSIYQQAGHEFNIGSPKQLGVVLFDEMQLGQGDKGKKGKSGTYSTDVDALEPLAYEGHQIVKDILRWRHLSKLKSTYTDTLLDQIHPVTGRIHTSYSLAGTNTGRLSSSDPNLQNIPVRTKEGREIRKAFVAEDQNVLISIDYSQIELRLVASIAQVKKLKEAFTDAQDVHTHTAMQIFHLQSDQVTPDHRRQAKAINFGILYGQSAFGLAQQIGCPQEEAKRFIEAYFNQYPEIKTYLEETKAFARQHGYVRTLFGRKCHMPYINDKNFARRGFAERQAINAPFQGTQADIIKKAMVNINRMIHQENLPVKMLLQVHDELVFECPETQAARISAVLKEKMESVTILDVPLIASAGIGLNWDDAH